ncbi:MAG: hypothetical protein ABEH66_04710 [Halobacteriales archaeon]
MDRRSWLRVLGGLASVGLAGCGTTAPAASLSMTPVREADLLQSTLLPVRRLIEEGRSRERLRLFERLLKGTTTTTGTERPLPEGTHLLYNDTVYQLSYEVVGETPATRYVIRLASPTGSGNATDGVSFSELPRVDRAKLSGVGLEDGEPVGDNRRVLYSEDERNRSELVPGPNGSRIAFSDGTEARFVLAGAADETIRTYRYTADTVASGAEYRERLLERLFRLTGLSENERRIVEAAISEDAYVVEHDETPTEAFSSLVEEFRGREKVRPLNESPEKGVVGTYLASFEGTTYLTSIWVRDESVLDP